MALLTFNPPQNPSFPYSDSRSPDVNVTKYGDGYIERAPKGLNHDPQKPVLKWENLYKEEADAIFDFFEERAGYKAFMWIAVDETVPKKWFCPKYAKTKTNAGTYTIAATFERDFAP